MMKGKKIMVNSKTNELPKPWSKMWQTNPKYKFPTPQCEKFTDWPLFHLLNPTKKIKNMALTDDLASTIFHIMIFHFSHI